MENNIKTVFRLVNFVKKLIPLILVSVVFAVSGFIITMYIPAKITKMAFQALSGEGVKNISIIILICLAIMRGLFRYGEHYFGHLVAFKILANFRSEIFGKLRKLAPSKLDMQDSGALLKLIGEDVEALEVFFAHTLAPITTGLISAIFLFVYFLNYSIYLSIVAVLTYFVIAVALPKVFLSKLKSYLEIQQKNKKSYTSYFLDSLKGVGDILQLGIEEERFDELKLKSKIIYQKESAVSRLYFSQFSSSFLVVGLGVLVFAYIDYLLVQSNILQIQDSVICFVVFAASFSPFLELSRLPLGFGRALGAAKQVFSLLDEKEAYIDKGAKDVENVKEVTLEGVDFAYPNKQNLIFENLNVKFSKQNKDGNIIGLIGESGSGKSTLMKIVMKWYLAKAGKVKLNSQDILDINANKIQEKVAYIPQFPQIFSQTIRENLTLGNKKITDDEILEMAEKCNMKEKILSTKNGLDTKINSEKIEFSSGEMQRLELMRALLKKADIYIFDEPTSNLDTLNESIILNLIKKNCKGLVFIISHRKSTVSCSDVVFRVENRKCYEL